MQLQSRPYRLELVQPRSSGARPTCSLAVCFICLLLALVPPWDLDQQGQQGCTCNPDVQTRSAS